MEKVEDVYRRSTSDPEAPKISISLDPPQSEVLVSSRNPTMQALLDIPIGLLTSLISTTKIFSWVVLVFQGNSLTALRNDALCVATSGVVAVSIPTMFFSSFPYVVCLPDPVMAPFLIRFNSELSNILEDEEEIKATFVILLILLTFLSAVLHVVLAQLKILRFGQFLPYSLSSGMFGALGLLLLQRSMAFCASHQIIPTLLLGISLSVTWIGLGDTNFHSLSFIAILVTAILIFYVVIASIGYSVEDMRALGWMVNMSFEAADDGVGVSLLPWLMWSHNAHINFSRARFDIIIQNFGISCIVLLFLLVLYHSIIFSLGNRILNPGAKINSEMQLHGVSNILASLLGGFGGVFSLPDMDRVKQMTGGEVLPSLLNLIFLYCFMQISFLSLKFLPRFFMAGILAAEGFIIVYRFLVRPYKVAGIYEWLTVALVAVTCFFDFFLGFFVGTAVSLLRYAVRFYRLGCVKSTGTGLIMRSTADRDDVELDWLANHGEKIRVIQLRGTVAFANSIGVLEVVCDMLEVDINGIALRGGQVESPQQRFLKFLERLRIRLFRSTDSYDAVRGRQGFSTMLDEGRGMILELPSPERAAGSDDNISEDKVKQTSTILPLQNMFNPPTPEDKSGNKIAFFEGDVKKSVVFSGGDPASPTVDEKSIVTSSTTSKESLPLSSSTSIPSSSSDLLIRRESSINEFFKPEFLVVDMALTVGVDTAAIDTFQLILDFCKKANVVLCLSGTEAHLDCLLHNGIFEASNQFPNLDAALQSCENCLLMRYGFLVPNRSEISVGNIEGREIVSVTSRISPQEKLYDTEKGFISSLRAIQDRHEVDNTIIKPLQALIEFVRPIRLNKGEIIMDTTHGSAIDVDEDGLFFIESGRILVERDVHQSTMQTTRTQRRIRQSVPPRIQRLTHRNFQLGTIGPGWLVGANELCSGYRSLGTFIVDSDVCYLHFLPFRIVYELEETHPVVALNIFRLSSILLADRLDRTREQLSHMFDTVYGPATRVATATEKALKKARSSLFNGNGAQNNVMHSSLRWRGTNKER